MEPHGPLAQREAVGVKKEVPGGINDHIGTGERTCEA